MITPDDFDTLVRDTLHDVDAHHRPDTGTADRLIAHARGNVTRIPAGRRWTGWTLPLVAAAVVLAVAVALVLTGQRKDSDSAPPGTHQPTSVPTAPAPTTDAAPTLPPSVPHFRTTSVWYLDSRQGWALGDGSCPTGTTSNCATVLHTSDGGNTWQPTGVPAGLVSTKDSASCGTNGTISGPCVDKILFATPQIGYLWSFHASYLTTDGGGHWQNLHLPLITQLAVVGDTVVRMSTAHPCSSGCSYGVFAAPAGSTQWHNVIPFSAGEAGPWELAGRSGVAYVLEQFPGNDITPENQRLYRSTDGEHWQRVTTAWPCGTRAIDTISVDPTGTLGTTCV